MSFPTLEKRPSRFQVGDLVGHKHHEHLAGIILEMEYATFQAKSGEVGRRSGTWKAWIHWNGDETTKDFVEVEYLIKLM